jgi:hypothetical protein
MHQPVKLEGRERTEQELRDIVDSIPAVVGRAA